MSKVYDALMKSGNFTAAQNKVESGECIDSVGELVAMCEKEGYIERYYTSVPQDKVDEALADNKRYLQTLIGEETNLSTMIESAIKQNEKEDQHDEESTENAIVTEDDLSEQELNDIDFEEFSKFVDEDADNDGA